MSIQSLPERASILTGEVISFIAEVQPVDGGAARNYFSEQFLELSSRIEGLRQRFGSEIESLQEEVLKNRQTIKRFKDAVPTFQRGSIERIRVVRVVRSCESQETAMTERKQMLEGVYSQLEALKRSLETICENSPPNKAG